MEQEQWYSVRQEELLNIRRKDIVGSFNISYFQINCNTVIFYVFYFCLQSLFHSLFYSSLAQLIPDSYEATLLECSVYFCGPGPAFNCVEKVCSSLPVCASSSAFILVNVHLFHAKLELDVCPYEVPPQIPEHHPPFSMYAKHLHIILHTFIPSLPGPPPSMSP